MANALAIAGNGLRAQEMVIDNIAHDLANLNTPNYKAGKLVFQEIMHQSFSADAISNTGVGLGVSAQKMVNDLSQGPLKASNHWTDLAINGPGFFQVTDNEGNLYYTRQSSLSIDDEHYLCSQNGFRLADNIQIPEEFSEIVIHENGEVEAIIANESEPQLLGNISLAHFIRSDALQAVGNGLYTANDNTDPIITVPGKEGSGQLLQKQIEASNVDMVTTLTQLTQAQRVYQLNAKALQVANDMEKILNELYR